MTKRTYYEAPVTELFRVEMEAGFCTGSGDDATSTEAGNGSNVTINGGDGHEGEADIEFGDQTWG